MRIVIGGREVRKSSVEIENVNLGDFPDFCDAFVGYAEFMDGTELNESEKQEFESKFGCVVNELAHASIF